MAAENFTITQYRDFAALELGYGSGLYAGVTAAEQSDINRIINEGYRLALYPPLVPPDTRAHVWSFLKQEATLTVWPTITGTAAAGLTTTVTATTAKFYPSVVGKSIVFLSGNSYTITAYTSSTVITVSSTAVADSSTTFTITSNGNYQLPDAFGSMETPFTYDYADSWSSVDMCSEYQIRELRTLSNLESAPRKAAIRFKASDGTAAQVQEAMFYPFPDVVYPLGYLFHVTTSALVDTTYPLGGPRFVEVILAAIRAVCEETMLRTKGDRWDSFMRVLSGAIQADRAQRASPTLGFMPTWDRPNADAVLSRALGDPIVTYS